MTVRDAIRGFYAATKRGEQVAKLIELGYALGFERSGVAAQVVKKHGHGKEVVDAMLAAAQYSDGDPWEYVIGVFKREKVNGQGSGFGGQAVGGRIGPQPADAPLTAEEQQALKGLYSAGAAAQGGGRTGNDAELDTEPVQGQLGEPVQQSGDDGGCGGL